MTILFLIASRERSLRFSGLMGGLGGMLVVSSVDGVIVEKVGLCRKWMVGS